MLKKAFLLLALVVNLTWADMPTRFTELSRSELANLEETFKEIQSSDPDLTPRLSMSRGTRKLSIIETYDDRAVFDLAAPSLPIEDFEGSLALIDNVLGCRDNPLDSGETECYNVNSINDGLGVLSGDGLVAVLNNIVEIGPPSTWVGANPFTASTSLVFTNGPTAVGLDFFNFFNFLGNEPIDITITYEDDDTETVSTTGGGKRFFGVITNRPIKEMNIGGATTDSIVVDNVAFGTLTGPPGPNPGTEGDPHFKTWSGQHYDYHGECDLVLIHNAEFESGLGLDVHIRTKLRRDMSFVSSASLRIGKDILEVASQGVYWFNGVLKADLPDKFSGFALTHTQPTAKQHMFDVHLGGTEHLQIKTYKDFVSVMIEKGKSENFLHSVGLMGDFGMGHMLARDGKTVIDDANAFGQEWQVRNTDPFLFQTLRFPQHPNVCTMPTPVQANHLRRRLAETSSLDEAAAEKACAHWGEQGKDDCVFDVLTTGDIEMAMVGAY
jgi:hypothetical protein